MFLVTNSSYFNIGEKIGLCLLLIAPVRVESQRLLVTCGFIERRAVADT